ncbi:clathrin-adaptor medium chain apm1 [Dictyostelium purpureum]|uniref:Clathrin-adaptor medium chain apm1 n=1 Tax=Dictyostelium purpureum TaxID=5786 RepID=F1A3W4_DICPU|nr:clathrin-adaptor medium chain apm1 [Dictyostelium purpureum]EGC29116.1 clathrin-adaptor medium chain apm1 [Dictyostelium purpureum]|eukprot:XP_003294356.1 clathrin-adaptor medium chain apm1 [Dictyostelium purpureum]
MAASAIFLMDSKGKVLISRNYRGDVPMSVATKFVSKILEEEDLNLKPIIQEDGISYIYVKHNNLFLLATTERNANAATILLFLYKMIEVFNEYFKELEEESIRDNFVIIYELLDEMMDFGYPQSTEPKILQEYITQEGYKLERGAKGMLPISVTGTITGAVSWRKEGIKYNKNEVFLDVVESINLLVSANGTVLRSEIVGAVKMKSKLSGMPELRLGLNDKILFENSAKTGAPKGKGVELEDVKFHQCVRLSKFENDRTISFIPPDGEFELMSYRLNTTVKPLIWVECISDTHAHSRVEYMVKAKSQFKGKSIANNVEIIVPVPPDADTPKFRCTVGTCKYAPEKDAIIWTIKQFPGGGREFLMRAHFGLPSISDEKPATKPPIMVKFEIPYYTVSGIQVRYLKIIEKSGYQALPWVRYVCLSGDYQFRTS